MFTPRFADYRPTISPITILTNKTPITIITINLITILTIIPIYPLTQKTLTILLTPFLPKPLTKNPPPHQNPKPQLTKTHSPRTQA